MKSCVLLLLGFLAQFCYGQTLRAHVKFCAQQTVEADFKIEGNFRISAEIIKPENSDKQQLRVVMDSGHIPAIKYSDVKVHVYDQAGVEIEVSPQNKLPAVYNLELDAEQSGSYNLGLKNGQNARVATITWRHNDLTFSIPEASVSVIEENGAPILEVVILTGNYPPLNYADVTARAFCKSGSQRIILYPLKPRAETYETSLDGTKNIGRYRMLLGPGYKVAYVYLDWKRREVGFYAPNKE
jgi:ribulose bisphosphate carboxylase small subunit